nr:MAG TPA: hypothetical protein [Caudoviricetes sp.]
MPAARSISSRSSRSSIFLSRFASSASARCSSGLSSRFIVFSYSS